MSVSVNPGERTLTVTGARPQFARQRANELLDGPFASKIERQVGGRQLCTACRNGDNATTVPDTTGGFLKREENAFGIDIENEVVILLGALDKGFLKYNPCIGHNDVETSHLLFRFGEQSPYLRGFRNIGLNRRCLTAPPENTIHCRLRRLFILTVVDNDTRPIGCETLGDRFANAARCSGNECIFSFKCKRHESSLLGFLLHAAAKSRLMHLSYCLTRLMPKTTALGKQRLMLSSHAFSRFFI
jgi:hypothetical protein